MGIGVKISLSVCSLFYRKIVIKLGKKKRKKTDSSEELSDDDRPTRRSSKDDDSVSFGFFYLFLKCLDDTSMLP